MLISATRSFWPALLTVLLLCNEFYFMGCLRRGPCILLMIPR